MARRLLFTAEEVETMLCKDVMLSLVYKCRVTDTAQSCAAVMATERIGFLPVVNADEQLVGVVTDRDLALRIVGKNQLPTTPVEDVMTSGPLLTCSPDENLFSVESRMAQQKKGRALVVDEGGHCVGIISLSDIAQIEEPPRTGRLLRDLSRRESVQIVRP